jgi:hypothetical protein
MPNAVEKVAAKSVGKAKQINARLEGLTGVFAHLAEEHGEASTLLARLRSSDEAEKRDDLWDAIRKELVSHERAEMSAVYPVFRQHSGLLPIAEEHDQEAGELEKAIARLDGMDFTADGWEEGVEQLIALLEHHVEQEEHNYFQVAQKVLDEKTIHDLEDTFHRAKDAVKRELA